MLSNCLLSIRQTSMEIEKEIFVVDNNSSDGSREMIREFFPEVRLINSGENMGFANANNLAIPFTHSPLVLFLNPDTIVKPHALSEMRNIFSMNSSIGAIGCKIINFSGMTVELPFQIALTEFTPLKRFFIQLLGGELSNRLLKKVLSYHNPDKSGYVKNLYGACLMVRRDTLEQVGYFDGNFFMYCEDIDLCNRISQSGWKLYYTNQAEIVHLEGGASNKAPSEFSVRTLCDSLSKLMYKYHGVGGKVQFRFSIFVCAIIKLMMLLIFKTIISRKHVTRNITVENSIHKYSTMIKWSLGT